MPRVTRAAVRNGILEDIRDAAEIPLPSTPQGDRPPLGEISTNPQEENRIILEVNLTKPVKKDGKGRKAKGTKSKMHGADKENVPEVMEDDFQSSASSAAEEAREELLRPTSQGMCCLSNQNRTD